MEEAAAVWIRDDDEGWLPGVVKKVDGDQIEVDVVDDDGTTIEAITLPTQEIKEKGRGREARRRPDFASGVTRTGHPPCFEKTVREWRDLYL